MILSPVKRGGYLDTLSQNQKLLPGGEQSYCWGKRLGRKFWSRNIAIEDIVSFLMQYKHSVTITHDIFDDTLYYKFSNASFTVLFEYFIWLILESKITILCSYFEICEFASNFKIKPLIWLPVDSSFKIIWDFLEAFPCLMFPSLKLSNLCNKSMN